MKGYTTTGKVRARALRKSETDAERRLWQLLRNRNLQPFKFRRQHPIGPYIVDFVCLDWKLVIEVDGGQHMEQVRYDSARTSFFEASGYRIVRFWNNDVLTNTDGVLQAICDALKLSPSP